MRLHYREFGQGRPLIILHGLFGSGRNWQSLARALAANYRVITPDLRNHGQSPHADSMPYQAMAADIIALARQLRLKDTLLLGHSMGGKVAMSAMLTEPDCFKACVIADIAPVNYAHDFSALVEAMHRLPLAGLKDRNMAEARLAATIGDPALRSFILQNLVRAEPFYRRGRIQLRHRPRPGRDPPPFPERPDQNDRGRRALAPRRPTRRIPARGQRLSLGSSE